MYYTLLTNMPAWLAGRSRDIALTGWINLDFIFVGVVALFVPRLVSAVLLFLAILADFFAGICQTYYLTPHEALLNSRQILSLSNSRVSWLCAFIVFTFLLAWGAFILPKPVYRNATALAFIGIGLAFAIANNLESSKGTQSKLSALFFLSSPDTVNARSLTEIRPARASLRHIFKLAKFDDEIHGVSSRSNRSIDSAAEIALRAIDENPGLSRIRPDIILILVESWGQSQDEALRKAIVRPYESKLNDKYDILQGTVPFYGPTIAGEDRELCGKTDGSHIIDATDSEFRECLPDRLQSRGFHTIAVHGMNGNFYRRKDWYSRIGFQEAWFGPDLNSRGLPDCVGAFVGICDASIADWISTRLERPSENPRFIYWVTLNSHLPIPNPPPLPALASCSFEPNLAGNLALCNWYRLELNVSQSVAAVAARDASRPAIYVIVGDHAPPFSDTETEKSFDPSAVPYLILFPKSNFKEDLVTTKSQDPSNKEIAGHPG